MYITHSYIGMVMGPSRCLFFLLVEDYIEAQSQFMRDVEPDLERFARKLGHDAAVVKPFVGDIDRTRSQVLEKRWTEWELSEVMKTPSLLMINQDFDVFDPRKHPWMIIHFGERTRSPVDARPFGRILEKLADAVLAQNEDFFKVAYNLRYEIRRGDFVHLFEAKPGILGFSIDLFRAAELIDRISRRRDGTNHTG